MASKPTKAYFPVGDFVHQPDALIKIGQIIRNPLVPDEVVSSPMQPLPVVYEAFQNDWIKEKDRTLSGSGGIWAQFLSTVFGIGGDLSASFERGDEDVLKFDKLETSFIRDKEYIDKSCEARSVQDFLQANPKTANLFMITGVKIARGASASTKEVREVGGDVKIAADATLACVPVKAGPKGGLKRRIVNKQGFSSSSDFVYAYRLRRIAVAKKTKRATDAGDHTKHASLYHGTEPDLEDSGSESDGETGTTPAGEEEGGNANTYEFVFGADVEDFGLNFVPPGFKPVLASEDVDNDEEDSIILIKPRQQIVG